MKKIVFAFSLLSSFSISAQLVDVRIISSMDLNAVNISIQSGAYVLYLDGKLQNDSLVKKVFQLVLINDSIEVRIPGDTLGRFANFKILGLEEDAVFKIKPIQPISGTRVYDHSLTITVVNKVLQ